MGAWQAGALLELEAAGVPVDAVLGISAGSCNGAAYALGVTQVAADGWINCERVLRLSPRLRPPSLFSGAPVWERLAYAHDDDRIRRQLRCRFIVPGVRLERDRRIYAEFDPATGRWDGPLALRVQASCAIPLVFPPVAVVHRGEPLRLVDGGYRAKEDFSFLALGECRDLIVLEMIRPEEAGRSAWRPLERLDQRGRETCRLHIDQGCAEWRRIHPDSRLFRVCPSRTLGKILDFSRERALRALALGREDARAFLGGIVARAVSN